MKRLFTILVLWLVIITLQSQTIVVNKPLKDFPDVYDLSTPLNAGVTISYFIVNGIDYPWDGAIVESYPERKRGKAMNRRVVDEVVKERLLNDTIKEVIIYKDSIAFMIKKSKPNYYVTWWFVYEDGKWLYSGEDGDDNIESERERFYTHASAELDRVNRVSELKTISTDTLAFVNYIKQHGFEPKEFLLEVLAKYPLVIYGEIHRRKVSWDLLSSALLDPRFPEAVGTVFVELSAYQQDEFDRFYASKELDTEIVLDIMRSFQLSGWYDKGQYDFLVNIWKLNKTLPADKKIRVVATDEQAPWKLLQTREDYDKWEEKSLNRNTRMADVIEHTMKTKTDKRNSLFITGCGHAYKSHVPGSYSSAPGQEPALTTGAQLVQRLSIENVFVVFQHKPIGNNNGNYQGLIRQGLFDAVFEITGNKPVAFHLTGSPFGAEPYDADYDMCFDRRVGTFADNFDGYIFLQPLKDEDKDYLLYDIISDKFIEEMKRRIDIVGWGNLNRWFDIEGEVTKEKIIETLKENYDGKKQWDYLFE